MSMPNRSSHPPDLLRLLVCWPDKAAGELEGLLGSLKSARRVSITRSDLTGLAGRLQNAGYYHVLVMPVGDFTLLQPQQLRRVSAGTYLVVLAPGAVTKELAGDIFAATPAALAWQEDIGEWGAVRYVAELCQALSVGQPINQAAQQPAASLDMLTPLPILALPQESQAIWPAALKQMGKPLAEQPAANPPPFHYPGISINIQNAVFGDYYHAEGDMANVVRSQVGGTKIVQSAGGDQININRAAGEVDVHQDAVGDQVNINRMPGDAFAGSGASDTPNSGGGHSREEAVRNCPSCGAILEAPDRYCIYCKAELKS